MIESSKERKVILYGLGNTIWDMIEYLRIRFCIVGCSDTNEQKVNTAKKLQIPFINAHKLKEVDYDYIIITSIYDDEITYQLTEQIGISREKILKRDQWSRIIFRHCFGTRNPDKIFYILSRPIHTRDGLFSYLFSFLEQLDWVYTNGYIPIIDMQSYKNQYLEEDKIGVENAWEYYFLPLSTYSLEEVYESKNVLLGYDDPCYKVDYEKKYNIDTMSRIYQKYIHYNPAILPMIQQEYEKYIDKNTKTLGVLYRGTDMCALQLKNHPIQPTVEELIKEIYRSMREWHCERIFLSTEDDKAVERLQAEFGKILSCTDQKRFENTGKTWLANIQFDRYRDRYLRGIEYLITIELLSRCDCLIAGICAGSVCAQIMNHGNYQQMKMLVRGEYQ